MKQITLAYPWTDGDGTRHEPDTTLELDDLTAKQLVQDGKARPVAPAAFDPAEHNVDDVLAHLATVDDAERERVLAAEQAGKARTTITNSEG